MSYKSRLVLVDCKPVYINIILIITFNQSHKFHENELDFRHFEIQLLYRIFF